MNHWGFSFAAPKYNDSLMSLWQVAKPPLSSAIQSMKRSTNLAMIAVEGGIYSLKVMANLGESYAFNQRAMHYVHEPKSGKLSPPRSSRYTRRAYLVCLNAQSWLILLLDVVPPNVLFGTPSDCHEYGKHHNDSKSAAKNNHNSMVGIDARQS